MPRKTKPAAAPEPQAADPFRITTDLLHEWRACADGIAEFSRRFPEGGVYADVIDNAYDTKQYGYARWLAGAAWAAWIETPEFLAAEITASDGMVARLTALAESDLTSSGDAARIGSSGYDAQIGSSGDDARIGSSGDAARIGSSGYAARIGSSGYAAQIGSSGDDARIGSSGYDARIGSSGDAARIGSSGDAARIGSSGYAAQIGSSGYAARIGSSGDAAQIGSSGYDAQIGSSGDAARIGSSGDAAQIDATGENAIVAIAGIGSTVALGVGGCAAVPYHDGTRTRFATAYVGENVEAGRRYSVNNLGEFVEAV